MNITQQEYFKRQTILTEIGEKGQQKLQNAKVLVIGCGGLGSPVAVYLATSGVGKLHLVDFDTVSISNLHRQVFYKIDAIKKYKAEVLAKEIKEKTPFTKVSFSINAVDKQSILGLISKYDIVVDGTDSLPIKYLINDACVLKKKPLVYGSLYKFDGYVSTFNVLKEDGTYSCNLRDAFPKIATDIPNCEIAGTLNPIVGIIALMQASEVIKLITKTGKLLIDQLLIYNALYNSQFKIKLKKDKTINFKEIFKNSNYSDAYCINQDAALLITSKQLEEIKNNQKLQIISVINNPETVLPFAVYKKIPHQSFQVKKFVPDFKKSYIIVCNKGILSYDITLKLKSKYPKLSVYSLVDGIENYVKSSR